MSYDILSDVLRGVRLRGAVFYYMSYGTEWAAEAPAAQEIASAVLPGADHVIEYHAITKGSGWAAVLGEQPVRLEAGDVILFPRGDAHVMSSAPGLRPQRFDAEWVQAHRDDPRPIPINYLGNQSGVTLEAPAPHADTNVVCGFLGCDLRPFNPLVATLPRLLHLRASQDSAWIAATLQQAVGASFDRRPGNEVVLERISEMIFVHAVRRYLDALSDQATGWLAGLRDRHVGRALVLLHATPARDWTIEKLGQEIGLSRSALNERFVQLVGSPPMQYLTNWRMQLAARLLRESHANVASIALEVGYDSEAAFARAFKRLVGLPPAAWRRGLKADMPVANEQAA